MSNKKNSHFTLGMVLASSLLMSGCAQLDIGHLRGTGDMGIVTPW